MNFSTLKFSILKIYSKKSLNKNTNKSGFTAISMDTARRKIHFSTDAILRQTEGSSAGQLSDYCLESSLRKHTCLALKTVDSKLSHIKLEQLVLWLGSNFR